jgi:hypothetical protein
MQTTRWARCSSTSSRPSRNFEVDLLRMRTREGMAITRANGKAQGKQPNSTPASERTLLSLHQAGHTRSRKSQNSSPSGEPPSIERSLARAVVPPRSLHESAIFGRLARSCERRARPPRRHAPLQLVKHDSVKTDGGALAMPRKADPPARRRLVAVPATGPGAERRPRWRQAGPSTRRLTRSGLTIATSWRRPASNSSGWTASAT